jgi:phosphoribosylformimino-5-aminoimidazole carboxamide ribotide isomerase
LFQKILFSFPQLNLIASGGVSCIDDLHELIQTGVDGAIVGKAIYEGRVRLEELAVL